MARLPTSLDMPAPNGAMSSGSSVDFSSLDRALQGVASNIERFDQGRREANDAEARRLLADTAAKYSAEATERWALYDGVAPDQDRLEAAKFKETFAPILARDDLSDGLRDAVRRQVTDMERDITTRATVTQAQVRAQRFAADRDANEIAAASRIVQDGMVDWAAQEKEVRDAAEPGSGLPGALTQRWDAFVAERIAPHPLAVQQRLKASFDRQRGTLVMGAIAEQERIDDTAGRANVASAANTFINRVRNDPMLLQQAPSELAEIAAGLPAKDRKAWIDQQLQLATASGIEGRIAKGDADGVAADLARGAYDFLTPQMLDQAHSLVRQGQAAMTDAKAMKALEYKALYQQSLSAVLRGEEPDNAWFAESLGVLKPEERASMAAALTTAKSYQEFRTNLQFMDAAQSEQALQGLEARVLTEEDRAVIGQLRKERDAEFSARLANPALYAMTPTNQRDISRPAVRAAWEAFRADPTPQKGEAYARQTLQVQADRRIPPSARRLLDPATIRPMIADLNRTGVDVPGRLEALGEFADGFGRYRGQAIAELVTAGMTAQTSGALMHYADQRPALELFNAGLSAKLSTDDTRAIAEETDRQLAGYARTMASGTAIDVTKAAVRTAAAGALARGSDVKAAVTAAVGPIVSGWDYGQQVGVPRSAGLDARAAEVTAKALVAQMFNAGQLRTPDGANMTAEQSRRKWIDILDRAALATSPDEQGVVVLIDMGSGPERLALRSGGEVMLPWAHLKANEGVAQRRARERLAPVLGSGF